MRSKTQQGVLDGMLPGLFYCAYDLKCRINTLRALERNGYVIAHQNNSQPGGLFCPRTRYQYRIKEDKDE